MKLPRAEMRVVAIVLFQLLIGIFSFSWILGRRNLLPLGHGLTLDGLRNYALLLAVLFYLAMSIRKTGKVHFSPEVSILALWSLYAQFTTIYADSLSYALRDSFKLFYPVALYLVIRKLIRNRRMVAATMVGLQVLLSYLILLAGVSVLIAFNQGWYSIKVSGRDVFRITDLPNTFAVSPGIILVFLLLVFGRALYFRQIRLQSLAVGALALGLVLITITRSYIVGLTIALIVFLWMRIKAGYVSLLVGIASMYTLCILLITKVSILKQRMFWDPDRFGFLDVFFTPHVLFMEEYAISSGRNNIWHFMISELHARGTPLLGGGLGSSKSILGSGEVFAGTTVAHGDYAKYLAELGYIGLTVYVLTLVVVGGLLYHKVSTARSSVLKFFNAILLCLFVYIIIVSYGYEVYGDGFGFMAVIFALFALRDQYVETSMPTHYEEEESSLTVGGKE